MPVLVMDLGKLEISIALIIVLIMSGCLQDNLTGQAAKPTASQTAVYSIAIDAGSYSAYTDKAGISWKGDQRYTPGSYGYTGGQIYSTTRAINGTTDPKLYQTEHYNMDSYRFTVPNGEYEVLLKFAEIYQYRCWPKDRIFSVFLNSKPILVDFDVFRAANGCFKTVDRTFRVNVTNSLITLTFQKKVDAPAINALQVREIQKLSYLNLSPVNASIYQGSTVQFKATAYDSKGRVIPTPVLWSSNGSISQAGLFTGTAPGTYYVRASVTYEGRTTYAGASVNVASRLTRVTIDPLVPVLTLGQSVQFAAKAQDSLGNVVPATVTWSSAGTISSTGLFTAEKPGNFTVSATASYSGMALPASTVAVVTLPIVLVQPSSSILSQGSSVQYSVGAQLRGASVSWTANQLAGTIDSKGEFTAGQTPGFYENAVVATVLGAKGYANVTVKAKQIDFYGTPINVLTVFGQLSYKESSEQTVTAGKIFHASGVVVDRSSKPNKVYVADTGNNRILGFASIGVCKSTGVKCTNDLDCNPGDSCYVDGLKQADMIIGQPDGEHAACNHDNNIGFYNDTAADELCLIGYPDATNPGEYWMRTNFDVDSQGNLYIPDVWNNRVLKYNQPFSLDKVEGKGDVLPDFVWGQDNFNANKINKGQGKASPSQSSLYTSTGGFDHVSARGASVDPYGNVWVADTFNYRVLRFPANSKQADLVLGQNSFSLSIPACQSYNVTSAPLDMMCSPTIARLNPMTGELFVLDEYPGGFYTRMLVFTPPFESGMTASRILPIKQDVPLLNLEDRYYASTDGFAFNTFTEGDYANGEVWVHDWWRVLLLDHDGNILKVIGAQNKSYVGRNSPVYSGCNQDPRQGFHIVNPGGSMGFDDANNMYLADEEYDRISRVALPYNTYLSGGKACLPEPNGGLFNGTDKNSISDYKFSGTMGSFIFQNQLVIRDSGRVPCVE